MLTDLAFYCYFEGLRFAVKTRWKNQCLQIRGECHVIPITWLSYEKNVLPKQFFFFIA